MKKYISIALIVTLLITGLLGLTGCEKNNNDNNVNNDNSNSTSSGVDLTLDFEYINDKTYYAHINTTTGDKVTEYDEEEPNFVRIENEKDNYILDINLDTESKESYEQFKTSAKEENEIYEETKFGKYDGYYSDDDGIYGYILLDTTDPTFNVFINFYVYLLDEDSDKNDIQSIFESSKIQNMLNNIEYKNTNK